MNSDSSLSIFLNESILSNQLKENEYFELKEKFDKIKFIQELTVDFEPNEENFNNWKPINKFIEGKSMFIKAMEEGYWVLIESIESAPEEIGEILSGLCGLNPEFTLNEGRYI